MNMLRNIFVLLIFSSALNAQERITFFRSNIHVRTDATMLVTETIEVSSEQRQIIHGIVREFPTTYSYNHILQYVVGFKIISVQHNDQPVSYHVKNVSNGKLLYIGDKNIVLPTGKHTYTITYETSRQIGFFKDFDELYWNVTGNGWRLPIDKVQARVFLPIRTPTKSINAKGYTGYQYQTDAKYTYNIQDNCVNFFTTDNLRAFQGLTIAVDFAKGIVSEPSLSQKIKWFVRDNVTLIAAAILLLLLLLLYIQNIIIAYRKNKPGVVIPLFYPPQNMTPSEVGFMSKRKFCNTFLSADIVDLAVRGLITIEYHSKDEYTLKRISTPQNITNPYDQLLIKTLFNSKNTLTITRTHNTAMQQALKRCRDHDTNQTKIYIDNQKRQLIIHWAMYIIILLLIHNNMYLFLPLLCLGIVMGLSSKFYTTYTHEGRKLQDAIDGFKLYLMTAEIDRMHAIGTPPTKTPELYEKYLPYAIALKIEKQWTAQFSTLFKELETQGKPYQPLWYRGNIFGYNNIRSNFTQSFSYTITSSSTPPGSYSGSGGSGRSGGGGGGGGGGGW
ncbi:DUF2207 domain-containing protein [Candidatus Babeliales bacterium]|nr:DUF2207 domain-containing protein [Candidatus Babeliales bacterium]